MTEKEAIYILRNAAWLGSNEERQKVEEAVEVVAKAIEALNHSEIPNSSEPKCANGCIYGWGSSECGHCDYRSEESKTGDTISRKAAIDVAIKADIENHGGVLSEKRARIIDKRISALPSAQPENDWIPCTKKAHPDTPFRVQVQLDNGWIITAYYQDGEWLSVPDCGEPLLDKWIEAWRELPEPYQEGEQDEH